VTLLRDANGQALAYVYFEDEPRRRAAAKLLTKDEAHLSVATGVGASKAKFGYGWPSTGWSRRTKP
jgi:hypothetical protein